ncbi:MAG: Gfo/Idh/MocA family oxidoreductase [Candidatus Sumerlaeota bacterium]|nr:Gfo/Idh/MocA family oxidoreductase [Candidatus Sumerlaeota bacterium]
MGAGVLRFGVLSTEKIGRRTIIPAMKAAERVEVAAIASRDAARAANAARELGIPRSYGSYEALLDDPAVDAVYIPLPNTLHGEWTIRAARKKKHVLCEKPLAVTAAEARRMVEACRAAGVRLMEAFQYRHHPAFHKAQELIASGAIGELRLMRGAFAFPLNYEDNSNLRWRKDVEGGSLMDVGCYCVNAFRALAGREPIAAQAAMNIRLDTDVDSEMAGQVVFGGGLIGQFYSGFRQRPFNHLAAYGAKGSLELPTGVSASVKEPKLLIAQTEDEEQTLSFEPADQYRLQVEHFARVVLEGEVPRLSDDDGVANMRVIEALFEAARSGRRVELK